MNLSKVRAAKADAAKFMEDEITHIIKTFGKRGPGDVGEAKAVDHMAQKCKEYGCDDIKVEPFDLHPASFMGWIYITVTLGFIAMIMLIVASVVSMPAAAQTVLYVLSILCIIIGGIAMIGQFVLYRQVIDKLFPKKTSVNLTATKKPTGEIKQRLLFNGHPDAACEWTFNYYFGGIAFVLHVLLSMVGLVYLVIVGICALCNVPLETISIMAYASLTFVPLWIGCYFLWNERLIVDGANDNLTGCYMGIAVLKALQEQGIELEHTEVGVLVSGSEEAGLRGAKAWCKKHENDYKDVETIIIAFDTIHEGRFLQINKRDLNMLVKTDKDACDRFKGAADKLNITCNIGNIPLGATDAVAFTQGGFKSIGITAMNHNLQDYYHTRKDTIGNLDLVGLADCYEVAVQFLEDYEN